MAKYQFLSDEWVEAARRIYAEAGAVLDAGAGTSAVRVNLVVTEVPFSDGPVDAHVDTTAGRVAIDTGHLPEPDVTVSMDYGTARTLFVGGDVSAVMQAFLAGRVKVDGDLSKLLDPKSGIWPGSQPSAGPQGGLVGAWVAGARQAVPGAGVGQATGAPGGATPAEGGSAAPTEERSAPARPPAPGTGQQSLGFAPAAQELASRLQEITE